MTDERKEFSNSADTDTPAKKHFRRMRATRLAAAEAAEKEATTAKPVIKPAPKEIKAARESMRKGRRLSPARAHFQALSAAKAAGDAQPQTKQTGEQYELMQAALWEARRTLKDIKSIEKKVDKKREILPQFEPYVAGVLESGQGAQDDVLMTIMVWLLDVGDLQAALNIAEYALEHGLQTPDRYQRDTASIAVEQAAEEAMKLLEREDADVAALIAALQHADRLTAECDMHDQIRAKLHKALGYALRKGGNLEAALRHLERALELNDRVGVKTDITQLEREIRKQNQQATTDSESESQIDAGEDTEQLDHEIQKQNEGTATADAGTESHADVGGAPSGE